MFTGQCYHCEHDSDSRGSKLSNAVIREAHYLGAPVVQAKTRSNWGVVQPLCVFSQSGGRIFVNIHTVSMEDSTDLGGNQPKSTKGIRPLARGLLFTMSSEDHYCYRCQSHLGQGSTVGTLADLSMDNCEQCVLWLLYVYCRQTQWCVCCFCVMM